MASEKLWTWEDIVHLPEHEQPEIVGGKPYYRAVPRGTHGHALGQTMLRLGPATRLPSRQGWWICVEPAVRLSPHGIAGPDLAGWRKDRLAAMPIG